MSLINLIASESQLLSERDRLKNVLAKDFSLNFKARNLNEKIAKLLGAKDWNTALGIVRSREGRTTTNQNETITPTWGEAIVEYIGTLPRGEDLVDDLTLAFDSLVFDHFGTSKDVSEKINNQGLQEQIDAIEKKLGVNYVWDVLKSYGIKQQDYINRGPSDSDKKSEETPTCKKCGTGLDPQGYCQDTACPYSDWDQEATADDMYSVQKGSMPHPLKRVEVLATAHDDGHVFNVQFDAAPYFHHILKEGRLEAVVKKLREIEWGGDYMADEVALFFRDGGNGRGQDEVKSMFDFLDKLPATKANKDLGGFECEVDNLTLFEWAKKHLSPQAFKRIERVIW